MTDRHETRSSQGQFLMGFISALVLLFLLVLGFRVVEWASNHPLPEALVALVTEPTIAVLDLFEVFIILLILWAIIYSLADGPRMNT